MTDTLIDRLTAEGRAPAEIVAAIDATATVVRTPCGDGTMAWRCWGDGPALVLLHGGHGAWTHWIRNVEALSRHFRVMAADMPGYGESAMAPEPYTAASLAEIVLRGVRTMQGDAPFNLAGFSFGGVVGGHVAAQAAATCASLTLVGSNGMGLTRPPTEPMASWRRLTDPAEIAAAHRQNLRILMIADPANIDDLAVHLQTRTTEKTRIKSRPISLTDTLRQALAQVTARISGIWGARDSTAGPHLPAREALLKSFQPDAPFRVIPEAGHWVAYEAAKPFNATLTALLAR